MRETLHCCCSAIFSTLRFAFFRCQSLFRLLVVRHTKGETHESLLRNCGALRRHRRRGRRRDLAGDATIPLWVNGRTGGGQLGNYADFTYWGPGDRSAAGVNKKSVNWDGYSHISDQNYLVRNALDCYCTGTNWCYIAAHSAGDLMIGYTLAMYGGTTRTVNQRHAQRRAAWLRQRLGQRDADGLEHQVGRRRGRRRRRLRARRRGRLDDVGWLIDSDLEDRHRARALQPQHHAEQLVLHVRGRQGHAVLRRPARAGRRGRRLPQLGRRRGQPRAAPTATRATGSATT